MKVIHRAIFKELIIGFVLALLAFNFVLISEYVLRFTRKLSAVGSSLGDMAMIVIYLQPMITSLTIPMAMLISILLTYSRMNADNEVIAMRASGMSFRQISRPVFTLGVLCFALSASMTVWLSPGGAKRLQALVSDVIARRAPSSVTEGTFNTTFKDVVLYAENRTESGKLEGIFIYDQRNEDRPAVLYASEGRIASIEGLNITMDLADGHLYMLSDGGRSTDLGFGRYRLSVPIDMKVPSLQYNEYTPLELLAIAADKKKPQSMRQLLVEFHRRFSLPVVCLALMILGPPLSLMAGRTGKLGGLALGLGVFATYYAVLTYAENLVVQGRVNHIIGSWAPAILLTAFSLWMFRRAART
jgi:lipopolysaccharide export system permease protein